MSCAVPRLPLTSLEQFCWTEVHKCQDSTALVMHKNEVVHKTSTVQVLIMPLRLTSPPSLRVETFPLVSRNFKAML